MSTTLPSDASKANCDASTDDPKQALLTDLADLVDNHNSLKGALGDLAQYDISAGGLSVSAQGAGTPDILQVASAVSSKTGAYTVVAGDRMKLIRASGTWTLSLTAASTIGDGFICFVRNYGSGTITIDPNSSETINGAATIALLPEQSGILVCSGSAWSFVGHLTALPDGTTATTQSTSDNSTKLATTAYADAAAPSSATVTLFSAGTGGGGWSAGNDSSSGDVSHGLSGTPDTVVAYLECTTAESPYSVGDRVYLGSVTDYTTTINYSISVAADASSVFSFHYSYTTANAWQVADGSGAVVLTKANWKLMAVAVKY